MTPSATDRRTSPCRPTLALVALAGALVVSCGGGGDPTPTLSAPSTGDVWGGTHSVQWSGGGDGNVSLLLSDDGGVTFNVQLAASTPNDGSFAFDTSAYTDDEDYRVRVVLSDGKTLTSGSFAIDNTVPVTTLTSPLGTEILGGTPTVTWTTTDAHPGNVELRLSQDDGLTYDTVIAASTPDDGVFEWTSSTLVDGTQYRLQVIATDRAANESLPSRSPQSFELDNTAPIVTLTSPLGGQSWSGQRSITWTTTESNPATVRITLSTNSGATFGATVDASAPDTGSYTWQTGIAPDGAAMRVRIVAVDMAGNASAPSSSTSDFTLRNLRILGAVHYWDTNLDAAVDSGDQLYVLFDKNITVVSNAISSFEVDGLAATFGAGATVAQGPELNSAIITLGAGASLRTRGVRDAVTALYPEPPTTADVSTSMSVGAIIETGTSLDAAYSGGKDIRAALLPMSTGTTTAGTAAGVAAGDFDNDGDADVLVVESTGTGTHVLLGNGAGSFVSHAVIGSIAAHDVAVGDVDGDGDVDHVIAGDTGAFLSLGDGAGNFAAYGPALGGGPATAVALADLDCDGDLDLFIGRGSSSADLVFTNDGAGGFTDSGQALGAASTTAVTVGDLDGDGDLDVVTAAASGSQPVRVWRNDGAGALSAGDTISIIAAQDVALGDLDGDGDLDVVIAVLGQNETFLNDGNGVFGAAHQRFGNNDNRGVALLDLDGDSDLDIVTVKYLDGERWWINDGTGRVTESSLRGLADNAVGVVAVRLDQDADLDLFVPVDGATHRAYFNSASGGQVSAAFQASTGTGVSVAATRGLQGDFDGDGDLDVLLSGDGVGVTVLANDGAGAFTAGATFGPTGAEVQCAGDVDCDGHLDLLLLDPLAVSGADLWLGVGDGTFSAGATGLPVPVSELVDADGDGDLDYVGDDGFGAPVLVLGDGAGAFTSAGTVTTATPVTRALIADFDLDGTLDVATLIAGDVTLHFGAGAGSTTSTVTLNTLASTDLAALDFDRDGDLDLLGWPSVGGRLEPFRNDLGAFATLALTGPTRNYAGVALFDANEDGHTDLMAWDRAPAYDAALLQSLGNGAFSQTATGTLAFRQQVLLGDFDRDGDADGFAVRYDTATTAAAEHSLALWN